MTTHNRAVAVTHTHTSFCISTYTHSTYILTHSNRSLRSQPSKINYTRIETPHLNLTDPDSNGQQRKEKKVLKCWTEEKTDAAARYERRKMKLATEQGSRKKNWTILARKHSKWINSNSLDSLQYCRSSSNSVPHPATAWRWRYR